ncbi:MAG: DUF4422 domain-containing protein [Lachnospiraceae bacterium]|nr:DUF4422 domain-containing protein [Lachnospiraceae bacterium]
MKITIYVCTHKKAAFPADPVYRPIHVGRTLSQDLGYPGDDSGDNISELNPLFVELTGMYWAWKNDRDSDAIGLCHYRRYFFREGKLLSGADYEEILKDCDMIASDISEGENSCRERFAEAFNGKDLEAMEHSVKKLYPEYSEAFAKAFDAKGGYSGNMIVMPRKMFHAYCEWLFSILFDASEEIDTSGYNGYQKKVFGLLGENMPRVWALHHGLKVYECPIGYSGEKAETKELKLALKVLVKQHKIAEARELFYGVTKQRPDVMLPASDISGELRLIEQLLYIMAGEGDKEGGLLSRSDDLEELLGYYRGLGGSIEAYESRGDA